MKETLSLVAEPQVAYNAILLKSTVSTQLGIDVNRIKDVVPLRRSIDARQRKVKVNLKLDVYIDENAPARPLATPVSYAPIKGDNKAIIVGAGPAGLFAALRLIEHGIAPIVLERGKDVDSRRADMAMIAHKDVVDPDSNYCFGEGGAGAFSDGKLYTRSKKRGDVEKILNIFAQHGAPEDILVDAHPHIGTDKLPGVIKSIRATIERCGGKIIFGSRVETLIIEEHKVIGVKDSKGREFFGPVILATGHSARDTYHMLDELHVGIEPKGIAVGVRLEHPQHLIDQIQYHSRQGRGKYLPAAEYSMLTRVDGRAVYSFCMCPGGVVIPSASGPQQNAVNGMSPSNRGTKWANSGMVVEILPDDLPEYDKYGKLKVMKFQEDVEKRFYDAAGCTQKAPAQRMTDFVSGKKSADLSPSSFAPGLLSARVDELLPKRVSDRLRRGFEEFGRKSRGFLTPYATVLGCETRTSAPIRIVRDANTLESVNFEGLFPAGEGAGYAGGIVSAAIDGERAADALAERLGIIVNPS